MEQPIQVTAASLGAKEVTAETPRQALTVTAASAVLLNPMAIQGALDQGGRRSSWEPPHPGCAVAQEGGGRSADTYCGYSSGGRVQNDQACGMQSPAGGVHADGACGQRTGTMIGGRYGDEGCALQSATGGLHRDNDCGLQAWLGGAHKDNFCLRIRADGMQAGDKSCGLASPQGGWWADHDCKVKDPKSGRTHEDNYDQVKGGLTSPALIESDRGLADPPPLVTPQSPADRKLMTALEGNKWTVW